MTVRRLTVIDLFAGAGGLSLGFEWAGFEILAAIERQPHAAVTYALNHPNTQVSCSAVQQVNLAAMRRQLGLRVGELFALIGGPPCQGFSESNRRTRNLTNRRNHLYKHFLAAVYQFRPKWVVIENVAGLLTLRNGAILRRIVAGLETNGYRVQWNLLNAADYGVPQLRRRVFIVGSRPPLRPPKLSGGRSRNRPTVRDALADLPKLSVGASVDALPYETEPSPYARFLRGDLTTVTGNLVTANSSTVRRRYRFIPQGGNWEDIPDEFMENYADASRCHTGIYRRLGWDGAAKVIGNFRKNMLLHPAQHRGISVREAARLQSFPDWYRFSGSIGFQQQQVADAVPPLLARAVAKAILKASR